MVAEVEAAPAAIRAGVVDPAFAVEAKAWLDATALGGAALRQALELLLSVDEGDGAAAWSVRRRIGELIGQAKALLGCP